MNLLGRGDFMKRIYEFAGLSKIQKNKLKKDYIKREWKNLFLSYIFIILSSSKPFFSSKNGAIFVLIWFTLSILLSVYAYVEQRDYLKSKKQAGRYSKKHKNIQVENGANFFPQIGGRNFIQMQICVASLFCIVTIPISICLQFKDFEIYKEDYMNLFIGIFADTYIVAFFNIILQSMIDFIYDCAKDGTALKKIVCSLKLKDIVSYVGATIILIMAFAHYFNREFEGLFGDMSKKIMGSIYIIFMIFPIIKCLIQVSNNKKKVHR